MSATKTVIAICGPTASGKTDFAIDLALRHRTSIISADSRQCFKELDIGVAKPTAAQLAAVHHYFINTYSIFDEVTAGVFERDALRACEEVFDATDTIVLAGGTGLYVKAFLEGLHEMPAPPEEITLAVRQAYEHHGIAWLRAELELRDPLFASRGEMSNPQRMMRALAVTLDTGRSILSFHTGPTRSRSFDVQKIFLAPPREMLYSRIDSRVDQMMAAGLEKEARKLFPYRQLNALQTVGYRELFEYFEGTISLTDAVSLIKRNSRRYAKRQLTWFQKYFVDDTTAIQV